MKRLSIFLLLVFWGHYKALEWSNTHTVKSSPSSVLQSTKGLRTRSTSRSPNISGSSPCPAGGARSR